MIYQGDCRAWVGFLLLDSATKRLVAKAKHRLHTPAGGRRRLVCSGDGSGVCDVSVTRRDRERVCASVRLRETSQVKVSLHKF